MSCTTGQDLIFKKLALIYCFEGKKHLKMFESGLTEFQDLQDKTK
jgi:hypothetical protein